MPALRISRHSIEDPAALLDFYDREVRHGPSYYAYRPSTDPDLVTVEDLGLAVLLEGQPRSRAARSLVDDPVDISDAVSVPLHETASADRERIINVVMRLVGRRGSGFASSLATKVLHKKRPATIPVLDNQPVYATLCSSDWQPGELPRGSSIRSRTAIARALDAVYDTVAAPQNSDAWVALERKSSQSRIELFDMIWWAFVRRSALQVREES